MIRRAYTLQDFLFVRDLRNESKFYMTNYRKSITFFDQLKYMAISLVVDRKIYIYTRNKVPVAFLVLEPTLRSNNCFYLTIVVQPLQRGRGIGKDFLKKILTLEPDIKIISHILSTNHSSISLHVSTGFIKEREFLIEGREISQYGYRGVSSHLTR